jgi:hypothetical protein
MEGWTAGRKDVGMAVWKINSILYTYNVELLEQTYQEHMYKTRSLCGDRGSLMEGRSRRKCENIIDINLLEVLQILKVDGTCAK